VRNEPSPIQPEYSRPQGCLLRLFWMAFGNLALLAMAALIADRGRFSPLDGVYWLVVAALGLARYLDVRRFEGQTIEGEPATPLHLRRYLTTLGVLATGLWVVVHAFAQFLAV